MRCLALGHAWSATWEGAGLFGRAASDVGLFVVQGHLSLLVVRCGIRVEARVDRSTLAIRLLDSRGRSLSR